MSGGGLSCADHPLRINRSCGDCNRILRWFKEGVKPPAKRSVRPAAEQAHSAGVVASLAGLPEPAIAKWCESTVLAPASGPWAAFNGPHSVSAKRFWSLARHAGEVTLADLRNVA